MGAVDDYRAALAGLERSTWAAYLTERSGLPGPRGNIELAQAVADEGDLTTYDVLIASDDEYLTASRHGCIATLRTVGGGSARLLRWRSSVWAMRTCPG